MTASSWELACIRRLAANIGIHIVRSDLCQFGLTSRDAHGEAPAKKPTFFMTDSATIAKRLTRQCGGGHRHVHLMEGRAAKAAEYTPQLCREICKGLIEQKRADKAEVMMLSSVTWAECAGGATASVVTVAGMASPSMIHEMSLQQLLGKPLQDRKSVV